MSNTTLINHIRISRPFASSTGEVTALFNIELDDLVDGYDYHDFPPTVEIYFDRDTLLTLHEHIGNLLYAMKNMEDKNKLGTQ